MGFVKVKWNGPTVTGRTKAAAKRGLLAAGELVLSESQKVVPIEEGTLARSGRVKIVEKDGQPAAEISYGTPYAVRQHEEMGYRHDEGRTAKYLERPMLEERAAAYAIVAATMRGETK